MTDSKLVKSAGENFVCAMLALKGWAASLTRDGLARTDILAVDTHSADRRLVEIQVKACSPMTRPNWPMGNVVGKCAQSEHEWVVLVMLKMPPETPRYFVVPRDHVVAGVHIEHMSWLTDTSVPEGRRSTPISNARTLSEPWLRYEDRWDLLEDSTRNAPVMLPQKFFDLATTDRVGLPDGHPWRTSMPEWSPLPAS